MKQCMIVRDVLTWVSRVVMNVDGWYENKSRGAKWCLMVMAILRKD